MQFYSCTCENIKDKVCRKCAIFICIFSVADINDGRISVANTYEIADTKHCCKMKCSSGVNGAKVALIKTSSRRNFIFQGIYSGFFASMVSFQIACSPDGLQTDDKSILQSSDAQEPSLKSHVADKKLDSEELLIEPVSDISFDGGSVNATVMSTGCTTAESFEVSSELLNSSCVVTLLRNKPDYCRRIPFAVEVSVSWEPDADCVAHALVFTNSIVDMEMDVKKPALTREILKP